MLNEPIAEGDSQPQAGEGNTPSEGGTVGPAGSDVNYIRVTPQEKEAIERVSLFSLFHFDIRILVLRARIFYVDIA